MDQINAFSNLARRLRDGEEQVAAAPDYRRLARSLKKMEGGSDLRIALMGNTTLDPFVPFLAVELARAGWRAATHVSPFGQYMQDLAAPDFKSFDPQIVFLHLSLPLLRPDRVNAFAEMSADAVRALETDVLDEVERWTARALSETGATLVVCNFPTTAAPALGVADPARDFGETEFLLSLNLELMRRLRPHPRVQVLDLARVVAETGSERAFDARFMHIAKTDWTDALRMPLARECARHVVAATGTARKCLVLDLDNTLWGGVLGEDGPDGIRISVGDVEGEAYLAFQHRVRSMKARGVLLALCSKNDHAFVEEAFERRSEMPLRLSDFSATAIGWDRKSSGLRKIAGELNIGTDALVFVDDNPAEIAEVRAVLPETLSVLLPPDPADYVATFDSLTAFEKSRVGTEDAAKGQLYAEAAARAAAMASSVEPEDYLADLEMTVTIWKAGAADVARVHQLFSKTNQFNTTTKRYSVADIERFLADPDHRLTVCSLKDRFGEFGTIGLCLAVREADMVRIDSFVMSCRALARGVEQTLLDDLKRYVLEKTECRAMTARFVPTARNEPAARFYDEAGFSARAAEDHRDYELNRADIRLTDCPWLTVEER
ncbi:HAD-IIIC family phosphatase [uncultured Jannaschia sp.]|uniref:HAD-IIIC family phosphatase n=1 Tax=uncultured Jannaschia sp. TaxID=293347 RepID=UPI00260E2F99|nr:HAD-IIIC family phosphatase [uncultured Jannaschia sp.]